MKFTETIKKNGDFVRVYKSGRHFAGKYLILYVLEGIPDLNAIGVTIGRKYGKSVRRNYLKRLIKESYRLLETYVRAGYLLVFVARARQDTRQPDFYEIRKEMGGLFRRAGVLDSQKWEDSQKKA